MAAVYAAVAKVKAPAPSIRCAKWWVGVGVSRHAEVAEHGVGFPSSQELDDVRVNAGAQEGGGPTRAEASGAEQKRVDAS